MGRAVEQVEVALNGSGPQRVRASVREIAEGGSPMGALVTLRDLDSLDRIYHLTELIQSSPIAVERSVHAAIGGAYRSQGITTLELRFNPMKRNRGGERDLDHIILAAIRGLDLASLNEHAEVASAIEAGDPAAASDAMKRHISTTGARLETIAKQQPDLFSP